MKVLTFKALMKAGIIEPDLDPFFKEKVKPLLARIVAQISPVSNSQGSVTPAKISLLMLTGFFGPLSHLYYG